MTPSHPKPPKGVLSTTPASGVPPGLSPYARPTATGTRERAMPIRPSAISRLVWVAQGFSPANQALLIIPALAAEGPTFNLEWITSGAKALVSPAPNRRPKGLRHPSA